MEGLNYLCLCGFLGVAALFLGGAALLPIFAGARAITVKKPPRERKAISLVVALSLSGVVACTFFYIQFAPAFPGYYVPQRRVQPEDIVGTWVLRPDIQEHFPMREGALVTPTIEFREDGTFSMTEVPNRFYGSDSRALFSGQGTWDVAYRGEWIISATIKELEPPLSASPPRVAPTLCPGSSVPCGGLETDYELFGRQAPYILILDISSSIYERGLYFVRIGDKHE